MTAKYSETFQIGDPMTARTTQPPTGYRRRDRIERHTWRTGLAVGADVAEAAAITVCGRLPGDKARDMLALLGIIHPDGPARVDIRVSTPRPPA